MSTVAPNGSAAAATNLGAIKTYCSVPPDCDEPCVGHSNASTRIATTLETSETVAVNAKHDHAPGKKPRRLRCLFVTPYPVSHFGGVERVTGMLQSELPKYGIDVDVLDGSSCVPRIRLRLGLSNLLWFWLLSCQAKKRATDGGYDVILVNGDAGWAIRSAIPLVNIHHGTGRGVSRSFMKARVDTGAGAARRRAVRFWSDTFLAQFQRLGASHASVNVPVSESTAEELHELYRVPRARIRVIENGVDLGHFRKLPRAESRRQFGLDPASFVVLFVGRNEKRKGVQKLIDFADLVHRRRPDCIVVAATNQPIPSVHVVSLLNVPYDDLPALYSAADVFLLPTFYEACSLALIEAMACSTPILVSSAGHAREISSRVPMLSHYILSVDASSQDYAEIALSMISDPETLRELAEAERSYCLQYHDLAGMVAKYADLIRGLADVSQCGKIKVGS